MSEKYRLREIIRAVRLKGEQAGGITELPAGSTICVLGKAAIPGLVEVECGSDRLALFLEDLQYRSDVMRTADLDITTRDAGW